MEIRERGLEEGMSIQGKADNDASISATPDPAVRNVADVNGIGIYSTTARWTDMALEPKRGLDASNTIFLVPPRKRWF